MARGKTGDALWVALAALAVLVPARAVSQDQTDPLAGVDVQPAIDYLKQFVYVTTQPITTFKWIDTGAEYPELGKKMASDSPIGLKVIQEDASKFWTRPAVQAAQSATAKGRAPKPEPTSSPGHGVQPFDEDEDEPAPMNFDLFDLGGFSTSFGPLPTAKAATENWALIRMDLGAGMRILDLSALSQNSIPLSASKAFEALGCVGKVSPKNGAGVQDFSGEQCAESLRAILKREAQVDAIYNSVPPFNSNPNEFDEVLFSRHCDPLSSIEVTSSVPFQTRLNLIRTDRVRRRDIHILNPKSESDAAERLRLQTLISLASEAGIESLGQSASTDMADYPGNPGYRVRFSYQTGKNSWRVTLYNDATGKSKEVDGVVKAPDTRKKGFISSAAFPKDFPEPKLLWKDLEGKRFDPETQKWMKERLLGCAARKYWASEKRFAEMVQVNCDQNQKELSPDVDLRKLWEKLRKPLSETQRARQ